MINKKYYIELQFKEPLNENERKIFNNEMNFWKVFKDKDGKFYTDALEPKEILSAFIGSIEDHKNILLKVRKGFFYFGDFYEDLVNDWKEANYSNAIAQR